MHNELKSSLVELRSSSESYYRVCNNVSSLQDHILKEIVHYTDAIPAFFSDNQEVACIKTVYKRLKELDYSRNKVIPCIDVERAGYLYNDYFNGMITFINDYINTFNSDKSNIELMDKQLQTAIQGDPLFIESLFGGKNNERQNKELTDAISNVEYFIDFLKILENIRITMIDVCNKIDVTETKYCDLLRLMGNSTCLFSNRMICTILDTYDDINNSLDGNSTPINVSVFKVF